MDVEVGIGKLENSCRRARPIGPINRRSNGSTQGGRMGVTNIIRTELCTQTKPTQHMFRHTRACSPFCVMFSL